LAINLSGLACFSGLVTVHKIAPMANPATNTVHEFIPVYYPGWQKEEKGDGEPGNFANRQSEQGWIFGKMNVV
jgi:hypothetical protein